MEASGVKNIISDSKSEEIIQEGIIPKAKPIQPLNQTELKLKAKCFCKIIGTKVGTGFFCKMIYENELVPVLITNYHVIDDNFIESKDSLKVYINEEYKIININKIIYSSSNNKYDIIIIRLEEGWNKKLFENWWEYI